MLNTRYAFNGDCFAYEVFPDEVVVLDVIDGAYFSLGGTTPVVWPVLIEGHALGDIATALARTYELKAEVAEQELHDLTRRLSEERILVEAGPGDTLDGVSIEGGNEEFRSFSFEKHVDMQDLLTLDPIHDVDPQAGWPRQ